MARPVFRKVSAAPAPQGGEARSGETRRIAWLDRDRALVEAAQADPSRFDALYRKYVAQVYSYAHYELGDHHAAEDATEKTFVRALTALPTFQERALPEDGEGASTFRVWLFQVARNVVANDRRASRRHPTTELDAAADLADPTDLAAGLDRREEAADAWAAVSRLPADRRRAVILRFVEEMSTAEIAGVLGKSEGAVRVLLHRALRSVADDLGKRR